MMLYRSFSRFFAHKLPDLPYSKNALQPYISQETLVFHHEKHHAAYVKKLNDLVKDTPLENKSLEQLITTESPGVIYNQAAQVWNHTFYWNSMKPQGGGEPSKNSIIYNQIIKDFGSFNEMKEKFTSLAASHFGSGWCWLSWDKNGKLILEGGHDANNPMTGGRNPILTCDVWEHAYYVDYRNERPKYLQSWWNLVNWDFAEKNLKNVLSNK